MGKNIRQWSQQGERGGLPVQENKNWGRRCRDGVWLVGQKDSGQLNKILLQLHDILKWTHSPEVSSFGSAGL